MMRMTFSAIVEEFDQDAYLKALQVEVRRVFLKAGQRFLIAAIPRIPIWTGMARGAFRNLEDVVGKVTKVEKNNPATRYKVTTGRRGGNKDYVPPSRRHYYYYPPGGGRIRRTPEAGRQFATAPNDIFDFGGATLSKGRTAFYFRFEVNIKYFEILDTQKWHAFKVASDAVKKYVEANLELPDPLKFMTRKVVK